MGNTAVLESGLSLIGPLIGAWVAIVWVIVPFVLVRVLLRRHGAGADMRQTAAYSGPAPMRRRGLLLVVLPVSLFCGLMIAVVGGVIHPPIVGVVTPWVCDGGDAKLHMQDYSYKPGQHGTRMTFSCTDAQGQSRDITLKVLGAAALFHSTVLVVILLPLGWWAGRLMRSLTEPRRGVASPPPGHSPAIGGGPNGTLHEVIDEPRQTRVASIGGGTANALCGVIDNLRQAGISTVTANGHTVEADQGMIDGLFRALGEQARRGDVGPVRTEQAIEADIGERLLKLRSLHRSGAISDVDFEAKKAEILRDL